MIIGFLTFLIFLFTAYELSHDDFIFLRKGISTDEVFTTIFLGLPVALLAARIGYIVLHPSWRYLNPFIFFIVPYFPGLSIVGGLLGTWLFATHYLHTKKLLTSRMLDILGLSFLISFSVGILLGAIFTVFSSRYTALIDMGRGIVGISFFIFLTARFIKGRWVEGSYLWLVFVLYGLLALVSLLSSLIVHHSISYATTIVTGLFLLVSLGILLKKVLWDGKRRKL